MELNLLFYHFPNKILGAKQSTPTVEFTRVMDSARKPRVKHG